MRVWGKEEGLWGEGGLVLEGCCESSAPPSGMTMEGASSSLFSLCLIRKVTPQGKWRWIGHLREDMLEHNDKMKVSLVQLGL